MKQYVAKVVGKTISSIASYSVNTACCLVFGQKKEPESLKKLKKKI